MLRHIDGDVPFFHRSFIAQFNGTSAISCVQMRLHSGITAGDNYSLIQIQTLETQQGANYCGFNLEKHARALHQRRPAA